jgi:hypothetical protein
MDKIMKIHVRATGYLTWKQNLPKFEESAQLLSKELLSLTTVPASLLKHIFCMGHWVQFPIVSLEVFIDIILLAALWPWG